MCVGGQSGSCACDASFHRGPATLAHAHTHTHAPAHMRPPACAHTHTYTHARMAAGASSFLLYGRSTYQHTTKRKKVLDRVLHLWYYVCTNTDRRVQYHDPA